MRTVRRLGQDRLTTLTPDQQRSETVLFRQQIEMLNLMLRSDQHYLPTYRRLWSSPAHSRRAHDAVQPDLSVPTLALPPVATSDTEVKVTKPVASSTALVRLGDDICARLKRSRAHGRRLHCEVLGSDSCQSCIRMLDQAAVTNTCPVCLSAKWNRLSVPETDHRKSPTPDRLARAQTGIGSWTPVQVFDRVRQREATVIEQRDTRKCVPASRELTKRKQNTQNYESSYRPLNTPVSLGHTGERRFDSEIPEDTSEAKPCELRVKVTFGTTVRVDTTDMPT